MTDDLKVRLVIEALDRASAPLRQIGVAMGGVSRASAGLQLGAQRLGGLATATAQYAAVAGAAAATIGGGFLKSVIDTSAQFEAMRVQLTALEGSAAGAERALGFATEFAKQTPLELAQVVEAYAQLRTYGLDPTDGTLQALTDTMAKSGKGAEQLSGIITAVGQAWTKQKLQGEEIMQLLERGVPVWDLLAKATGRNVAELQQMSEKGRLGRDVIRDLVAEMGNASRGASADFARTWSGQVSMLSDGWTQFKLQVGEAGPFDAMKGTLTRLNAALADNGTASQRLAGIIGGEMAAGIRLVTGEIDGLVADMGGAEGAARNAGAAFASVAGVLAGLAGALRTAGSAFKSLQDAGFFSADYGSAAFFAGKGPAFVAPMNSPAGAALDALGVSDDSWFSRNVVGRDKPPPVMGPNLPVPVVPMGGTAAQPFMPQGGAAAAAGRAQAPASTQVGGKVEITVKSDRPVAVDSVSSTNSRVPLRVQRLGPTMQPAEAR